MVSSFERYPKSAHRKQSLSTDTPQNLNALSKLMQSWPGIALDDQGVLRQLNGTGTRDPLFWLFNASREPALLAQALGPDQPLIFGRSLHQIVKPGPDRTLAVVDLGRHYAHLLVAALEDRALWVGANCQAVSIVVQVVANLRATRIGVRGLCLISATTLAPVGLPGLLIYGGDDPENDPFRDDPDAAHGQALRSFSRYRRVVLPGVAHGRYFAPGTVDSLVERFQVFFDENSAVFSASSASAKAETTG